MFESSPGLAASAAEETTDETCIDEEAKVPFEKLADALATLAAQLDAGRYRFLSLVREIDEHGGWMEGGFRSTAHYLSWKANVDIGAAREQVRVARALPELPRIAEAFRQGQLSYSKVRAITRVATAENEEDLLIMALDATTAQLERIVRATRRVIDASQADEESAFERRYLNLRREWDGSMRIDGRLPPELGAEFEAALEAAMARDGDADDSRKDVSAEMPRGGRGHVSAETPDGGEEHLSAETPEPPNPPERTIGQRRADALLLLSRSALDHELKQGANADRMQVVLREEPTSQERLAETPLDNIHLADGTRLAPDTARRLCCDISLVDISLVEPDGRKRRVPNPAQRRALADRHRCCAFPGCTRGHTLQAHHIEHWADGGETRLDNLVLLCSFHHHLVHEGGFGLQRGQEGALGFVDRRGERLPTVPPGVAPMDTEQALALLEEELRAEGIHVDADTALHGGGGRFDLGWAVELVLAAGGGETG